MKTKKNQCRVAEAEEWLRDLEDRMMEITVVEQNKFLKKKKEK